VEEKACFDISLGENASAEELETNTIPISWARAFEELTKMQVKPIVVMVLGTVDSGKTSFCTYLVNRLIKEKRKVAILDGDLGQSDVGPPCTVAYAIVTKPTTDLFNLATRNAFFVGVTSPNTSTAKVVEGLIKLKEEILGSDQDFVVIDTDGWTEGEEAVNYKIQLVKELKPNVVFCIQQKNELETVIDAIKDFKTITVDSPPTIKQRTREKRRSLRELGYIKYLRNAKVQSIPSSWLKIEENELFDLGATWGNVKRTRMIYEFLGMKPLHMAESKDKISIIIGKSRWIEEENLKKIEDFSKKKIVVIHKGEEEGLLMALYDAEKKFLGIGILQGVDYKRQILKILTPVSKEISIVAFGKVKLDSNFKESPVSTEVTDVSAFGRLF
jgi:polynucleotide 5'-hydroxyl-kinase GRC3/NOL9